MQSILNSRRKSLLLALSPLKNSGVALLSLPFGGFGGFPAPAGGPLGGPGGGASGGCPPGACAIGDACVVVLLLGSLGSLLELLLSATGWFLISSNGFWEFFG